MKPAEFYANLLAQMDDETERRVFDALSRKIGQAFTRPELILEVFGEHVDQDNLASDRYDRMIRKSIEALRLKGFPILASSGSVGYKLVDDPDMMDAYIAEESGRIKNLQKKVSVLYRAKDTARSLREWRVATEMPIQDRLI